MGREAGGKSIVFPSFSSYFSPRCATVIKCLYVHFIVVDLCPVVSVELCRARVESIKFVHDDGDYGSAGSVQRVVWVFVMFGGRERGGEGGGGLPSVTCSSRRTLVCRGEWSFSRLEVVGNISVDSSWIVSFTSTVNEMFHKSALTKLVGVGNCG